MEKVQARPNITLSKSGLFQVSPAEIFKSQIGRSAIRKTAAFPGTRPPREQQAGQGDGKRNGH